MPYEIVPLPKERYKGYKIPFDYETDWYYDIISEQTETGMRVLFERKRFPETVRHRFVDEMYEDYIDAPEGFGVFDGGALIGWLEVAPERWNNRLRVWNLWVDRPHRGRGVGKALIAHAKAIAAAQKRRAIILETQSCNDPAIGFYFAQGFTLVGYDEVCYTNDDIGRHEVRFEFGLKMPDGVTGTA